MLEEEIEKKLLEKKKKNKTWVNLSQFNKPINRVIRPRLPNKRQIGKKKNDYETQFSINAIYVIEKKIDDKIKIKIIKIKFDIKNNLAVHFKKKKKMNGLRSPIRAPQPTNAACGGRPW